MGSFANLGALTGAAEGLVKGSEKAAAAKQHKLDQMREERLKALEYQRTMERDQAGYSQESKILGAEQKFETGERQGEQKFETGEREASERFEATQAELDRASDLDVEREKQSADKSKSRKWQYKTTEDKTIQNIDGSTSVEKGVTKVTNPYDHKTYEQRGDIFVPVGTDAEPEYPKNKAGAEKHLLKNPSPTYMSIFMRKYKYLPAEALAASERYLENQD